MELLEVPSSLVCVEGIPAEADFRLKRAYGRVFGFQAVHEGIIWWGDVEMRLGAGFVVTKVNGPIQAGAYWRLALQTYG